MYVIQLNEIGTVVTVLNRDVVEEVDKICSTFMEYLRKYNLIEEVKNCLFSWRDKVMISLDFCTSYCGGDVKCIDVCGEVIESILTSKCNKSRIKVPHLIEVTTQ